jgi:hypothetical protein
MVALLLPPASVLSVKVFMLLLLLLLLLLHLVVSCR